jgi:nitrite reductase/ring-hydroxylating ferredoxin subunit
MARTCSRRHFCAGGAAGLISLGVGACTRDNPGYAQGGPTGSPGPSFGPPATNGFIPPPVARDLGGQRDLGPGGARDLASPAGPFDLASPGPLDFSSPSGPLDFSSPGGPVDLASGGCAGLLNAGLASAINVGTAVHLTGASYDLNVCRDAGGLFAVDATCTHAGCEVKLSGGEWYCPCHGATYAFDGTLPTSPAPSPLPCYAVCVDGAGVVWVDYATQVDPSTRA